jgi:phage anti-repressor protein
LDYINGNTKNLFGNKVFTFNTSNNNIKKHILTNENNVINEISDIKSNFINDIKLEDLITKTNISKDFILDFYKIYKFSKDNTNNISIDINVVVKWLGTRKGKIKETLENTYLIDTDYKISKEKLNCKISKSNKEIILLTPYCFKRICLLTKTKKGEEIRNYFMELENLVIVSLI